MSDVPLTLLTTVEDVLALAAELGEHDISPAGCATGRRGCEARIAGYADAPRKKRGPTRRSPRCSPGSGPGSRCCRWSRRSRRASARPGAIDYADQVAYAARIAVASPEVGRRERARWKVVLLDEYQDTSVGQLRMLEALFGGTPGTRCWPSATRASRSTAGGAPPPAPSSGSTAPSPAPPAARGRAAHPGHQLAQRRRGPRRRQRGVRRCSRRRSSRCPTWRRRRRPAAARSPSASTTPSPRRPPRSPTGSPPAGTARTRPSAAGRRPARRRSRCSPAPASSSPASPPRCASAACPVEVVGLGGLLEVPEVSDVVATLTVLVDPTAGDALGRLLTGARWRIGPRDLAALEARARALVHSRRPAPPTDEGARRRPRPRRARQHRRGARRPRRPRRLLAERLPPAAPAGRRAGPPAQPAGRVAARPGRRGGPHARPGDRAGQRARTPARPAPARTSTRCTASPPSSPSSPSCRRCRRSSATCATPRSASAAWSRARSRSTPRRCSCSPGTRPRAWSGTSSPCPG